MLSEEHTLVQELALRPSEDRLAAVISRRSLVTWTACSSTPQQVFVAPAGDTLHPAWTPDGRYLGWIHHRSSDSHNELVVFDSVTQLVVSAIDLGPINESERAGDESREEGSLSLAIQPTLVAVCTSCLLTKELTFSTTSSTAAGLLVQRIVGRHKLFGRTVPTLSTTGRFPLGTFGKGRHKVRWNLTVNRRKLPPGRYYVTLRAITPTLGVRDLSRPFLVTIRKGKAPLTRPA